MQSDEVVDIFRETGALLEGHFIYTSGRHGDRFLQAARVLQHPGHTERMCRAMADRVKDQDIELVVGPATGGIILAYETARHLGTRAVFSEKDEDGGMSVRRGFRIDAGTRVLVVEDIVTTGGSVHKTIAHLRGRGAEVVAVAVLVDRSRGEARFDCAFHPLAAIELRSWAPEECALCAKGEALVEPDSIVV